uniref:Uncharacterized protein n=1 Tax=Oryza punctata TaxID=4537 RepID=A0A0E0M8L6_ORYPU
MVVGVVAGVEEVVVQRAVEPVVEELDGAGVEQRDHRRAIGPPRWQPLPTGEVHGAEQQQDAAEDDLVVPVPLPVHLAELDAPADDLAASPRVLDAGRRDPRLVVQHPEQHRRQDGDVADVHLPPPSSSLRRRRHHQIWMHLEVAKLLPWPIGEDAGFSGHFRLAELVQYLLALLATTVVSGVSDDLSMVL